MGANDKDMRKTAVPYYGQILGYNHSEVSDQDVSQSSTNEQAGGGGFLPGDTTAKPMESGLGDLYNLVGNSSQTDYMIRVLRPKFGQIVQSYLNISLTFATTEPNPKFKISVGGPFATDNITAQVPSLSFISNCMTLLNPPSGNYFTGSAGQAIVMYGINIQPLIPQVGQTNYVQDCYSIGIHFASAPVQSGTYHLTKFFVTGSIIVT